MQQRDKNSKKELFLTDTEAFAYLSRKTRDKTVIRVGSFGEFIKNIWSKSYEHPEWFSTWHVQLIAQDVEKALQDKKNYCAVLPRYHLKSTVLGHAFSVWTMLRTANPRYESTGMYLSNTLPLAQYHIREMKRAINRNEQLREWMEDKVPDSEMSFRYMINGSSADIQAAGVFSFERGRHINRFMVCLASDTMIRGGKCGQNKFGYIPIQDICVGDLVLTHRARYRKVLQVFKRHIEEEIVVLNIKGIKNNIFITSNHRILTIDGWKTAGELAIDDVLIRVKLGGITSEKSKEVQQLPKHRPGGRKKGQKSSEREIENFKIGIRNRQRAGMFIGRPKDGKVIKCLNCKIEFYISKKSKRLFCSLSCASSGSYNSRWNGGSSKHPWGPEFNRKLKQQVKEMSNFKCSSCNLSEETMAGYHKKLTVHHIDENKFNNNLVNLVALCASCHAILHGNNLVWTGQKLKNGLIIRAISKQMYIGDVYNLEVEEDNTYSGEKGIVFHNCDDVLRDPANPGNLSQLTKIEDAFQKEFVHIPVRGAPIVLLGTPMAPNDLLTRIKDDESFVYRFLPALDPMPGHRVLCPEIRTEQELLQMKKNQKESFASEMMLQPYTLVSGYINDEELQEVENSQLRSLHSDQDLKFDAEYIVAGVDVGKKRHPSHISIYASKKSGELIQIYQEFMDGWEYVKQAYHLNELAKEFNITKGYYDNTDRTLEERGMNAVWQPLVFNNKNKHDMARIFSSYVNNKKIEMIQDERQRSQITSVDINLNAITTPLGHGDAFWSNALALMAFDEMQSKSTISIGNMQDFVKAGGDSLRRDGLNFPQSNGAAENGSCPQCGESLGWVKERKLCLICFERF